MPRTQSIGFTLAELLISLAILAEIATFTIPKIVTAQANSRYSASAKEAISMVSSTFTLYTMNSNLSSGTTAGALTQYMNYTRVDTTDNVDASVRHCSDTVNYICLALHSGGVLLMEKPTSFGGTATTNALYFIFDPAPNGTSSAVNFFLYYNGRVTTAATLIPGTATSYYTFNTTSADPSWFSW